MAQVIQHPSIAKQSAKNDEGLPTPESSFIEQSSYDKSTRRLTMNTKEGGQYVYSDVPEEIWEQFKKAPSKGSFYAKVIRAKYQSDRPINKTVGPKIS